MRVIYSKTGSDGNCTIVESETGELVALDCGLKLNVVDKAIQYRMHNVCACLLSHHHSDHSARASELAAQSVPVYLPEQAVELVSSENTAFQRRYFRGVEQKKTYAVKNRLTGKSAFLAIPFNLSHTNAAEGDNCPCVGYMLVEASGSREKLLYATDTARIAETVQDAQTGAQTVVGHRFPPCSIYMLESNYVKPESYYGKTRNLQIDLEMRRMQSHMSAQTGAAFIQRQDLSACRQIWLIHISRSAVDGDVAEMVELYERAIRENDSAKGRRIRIFARDSQYEINREQE